MQHIHNNIIKNYFKLFLFLIKIVFILFWNDFDIRSMEKFYIKNLINFYRGSNNVVNIFNYLNKLYKLFFKT